MRLKELLGEEGHHAFFGALKRKGASMSVSGGHQSKKRGRIAER